MNRKKSGTAKASGQEQGRNDPHSRVGMTLTAVATWVDQEGRMVAGDRKSGPRSSQKLTGVAPSPT